MDRLISKYENLNQEEIFVKGKSEKLSLKMVKKLPYISLNRMINKLRNFLKKDEVVQKMFKEYNVDIEEIDYIPMKFGDLDVSAKTEKGIIIFNYKLLCDGDFFKDFSYGAHEICHFLQQTTGNKPTQSSNEGNYLDNPYEREAFSKQVEYIDHQFGEEEAEDYVENLLDHHEVENKKKRKEIEKELTKDI